MEEAYRSQVWDGINMPLYKIEIVLRLEEDIDTEALKKVTELIFFPNVVEIKARHIEEEE